MTRLQELQAIMSILEHKQAFLQKAEQIGATKTAHATAIEVNTLHSLLQIAVKDYLQSLDGVCKQCGSSHKQINSDLCYACKHPGTRDVVAEYKKENR